jgi:energy-coupling factor transporter ATP-binding protein EcfA2
MRFLGIELEGFACFERQFVRLQPGINLLAGRNNSGKTSVLRALTLLRNALREHQPLNDVDIRPYARKLDPQPHFDLTVIFEFEAADQSPFDPSQPFDWAAFIGQQRPAAAIHMRMWTGSNILAFRGAEMWLPSGSLPLMEVLAGGINSIVYLPPVSPIEPPNVDKSLRFTVPAGGSAGPQPGGPPAFIHITSPLIQSLERLRNVRLVTPHRVVADRLPLSTSPALATNAADLAPYLQTLHNNRRRKFQEIEDFVTSSFPEFERVDPASEGNQATLKLVRKGTDEGLPLAYCGTGVEQLLALAAVITESKPGDIILMDEPHSFLHPTAERALLQFLEKFPDRYFVIATHSSVFINGVTPDRITHLQPPGTPYTASAPTPATSNVLHDLGYRNSDALFFDQLVIVEGPSDADILPTLLRLHPRIQSQTLQNTGFLSIDGINDSPREIQTKILRFEKLLGALGRAKMPRLYLLDGDREPDDVNLLQGTRSPVTDEPINVKFLQRTEIENYLLTAEAIGEALSEEAQLANVDTDAGPAVVQAKLDELLASDDNRLFPKGKGADPIKKVKASRVLERLYSQFGNLRYDKNRSGQVVARKMRANNAIGLDELVGQLDVLK